MKSAIYFITTSTLLELVITLNLPGPLVYVVTPKSTKTDSGRSAPFYYHNWMRRMDGPRNATTTTTTTTTSSPDLIFAEFESDNGDNMQKSIRKLLEKERVEVKTSSYKPIYVPDESTETLNLGSNHNEQPANMAESMHQDQSSSAMEDYFQAYNAAYNKQAPVYSPPTTPATSTTTTTAPMNVEHIWHIIDNEKYNTGKWEEVPAKENQASSDQNDSKEEDDGMIDENFALPGFGTNPGNGAENESRAIRTEPNFRFPYVNLKTFQMKNSKPSNKKGNNIYMNLDNFHDISNPVRGEAQDVRPMLPEPIDRYNPAQPYLPDYGTKSKQSSPVVTSTKTVSNLVPPPPPPPPPPAAAAFPAPVTYDSFPPYAPSGPPVPSAPPSAPAPAPKPVNPPPTQFLPPNDDSDSPSSMTDDGPPMDIGYRYKAPAFLPTAAPPASKPFGGYSYNKPDMGYSYNKPMESKPDYDAPPEVMEKPQYHGYHYDKPVETPPEDDHPAPSYGPHDHHHAGYVHDYPELIYDKPGHGGMKGGDDSKGNDMGMMPPPPPSDMKPDMAGPSMDNNGFPQDFPGNFKFNLDFDHDHNHDFYHHHHHHPTTTTTTTTTETPRVNRYSYYYLGKKLYYLPLYFSVYFIVYVGALIIKAVLRHKIVYPNSWRPNDQTAGFFSKRSVDSWDLSSDKLHEVTGVVTKALATAAEKYMKKEKSS